MTNRKEVGGIDIIDGSHGAWRVLRNGFTSALGIAAKMESLVFDRRSESVKADRFLS